MFDCDPATVVDQQLAAWRARDAEAFASHYAADAVMTDHPGVVTFSGREAIQARYAQAFAARGPAQVVIETRIVSGDYVIDDESVSSARELARGVVIYRVQNCLITRADYLPFQRTPADPEVLQ
ncbi:MAG: SgcJ/EcaC family oxidoreductase [Brevundimonas sp.]|nr:SgcJ/EcaC family oxidoreductase [Brevundimonas sp.]